MHPTSRTPRAPDHPNQKGCPHKWSTYRDQRMQNRQTNRVVFFSWLRTWYLLVCYPTAGSSSGSLHELPRTTKPKTKPLTAPSCTSRPPTKIICNCASCRAFEARPHVDLWQTRPNEMNGRRNVQVVASGHLRANRWQQTQERRKGKLLQSCVPAVPACTQRTLFPQTVLEEGPNACNEVWCYWGTLSMLELFRN